MLGYIGAFVGGVVVTLGVGAWALSALGSSR